MSKFELIPKDVLKHHIFKFFNKMDLDRVKLANKTFHELSNESLKLLYEEFKDNIFYTVGTPIFFRLKQDRTDKYADYVGIKQEITDEALAKTLPRNGTLKLFKLEKDADKYALFLREIEKSDNEYYSIKALQPAVFKVILLDQIKNYEKKSEIVDKAKFDAKYPVIYNFLTHDNTAYANYLQMRELVSNFEYFSIPSNIIIPLEGGIKEYPGYPLSLQRYEFCKTIKFENNFEKNQPDKRLTL